MKAHLSAQEISKQNAEELLELRLQVRVRAPAVQRIYERLVQTHGQLSAKEAAGLMRLSESQFSSRFRSLTGVTFRQARTLIKVGLGAQLLEQSDLSIGEIADLLGYLERNKFDKAFKQVHGITPNVFRQKCSKSGLFFSKLGHRQGS
jgi:transcriptional regulator GlxA family with amidase domain